MIEAMNIIKENDLDRYIDYFTYLKDLLMIWADINNEDDEEYYKEFLTNRMKGLF
jgi:hypothetical protein